jgi:hypothetical protein
MVLAADLDLLLAALLLEGADLDLLLAALLLEAADLGTLRPLTVFLLGALGWALAGPLGLALLRETADARGAAAEPRLLLALDALGMSFSELSPRSIRICTRAVTPRLCTRTVPSPPRPAIRPDRTVDSPLHPPCFAGRDCAKSPASLFRALVGTAQSPCVHSFCMPQTSHSLRQPFFCIRGLGTVPARPWISGHSRAAETGGLYCLASSFKLRLVALT